jgi:TetR/AcrR family transcriptional regulator
MKDTDTAHPAAPLREDDRYGITARGVATTAARGRRGTAGASRGTSSRDPEATRGRLVAAAIAAFSRDGFAGARVDEIARAAGANKQLVYHYFDSKEGLYLAALEAVYTNIRNKEKKLHLGSLDPTDAMARLIGFSFDYLSAHPEFIALLVDENRNRGSHILASASLRQMHSPFISLLDETLERGIAQGVFRRGLDALDVYISIAGISYFYLSNNHTLSTIFDRDLMAPKARLERLSHMTDVVLGYLVRN